MFNFSRRQIEILLELSENPGDYLTASYFAKKQQISLRTVQTDIKVIKNELANCKFVQIESVPPKGSRLIVINETDFLAFKENLYQDYTTTSQSYQDERITKLIFLLLCQHRPISFYDVENTLYISRSTLLNDLKKVDAILQNYDLELMRGSSKIVIDGTEINKRRCYSGENLALVNIDPQLRKAHLKKIQDILVESFVAYKRNVSEVDLNNMITLLGMTTKRIEHWFSISSSELGNVQDLLPEREIAEHIFMRIGNELHIRIPEPEIDYFALYLKGRVNIFAPGMISAEVDELILDALREIRRVFNVDLTNDMEFRLALSMHCIPMIIRLKYDMQMGNQLVDYIRQKFPQSFDMASYFGSMLQKRYGKRVLDEEVAFLAIHIHKALTDLERSKGTKRILVITSLRRSENTLIRQTLYRWFADQIAELYFLPPELMDESYLDKYDTFLTTEKGKFYDNGLALYINAFPDEHDYLNLKLAIDGFESINDILRLFHRDMFTIFRTPTDKEEILSFMCKKAGTQMDLTGLYEAVSERENLRNTFFGNRIAAPHPITAVSSDTFISIGICPHAADWGPDGNQAQLIMLVCVGKNNSKAFQIWNYLSKIFSCQDFVERLLREPSYEQFLKLLTETISGDFNRR